VPSFTPRIILAWALLLAPAAGSRADVYKNFAELSSAAASGKDYRVVVEDRKAPVTVFAIHGGLIEPGTAEIARALAGSDWNLYVFEGLAPGRPSRLHVTAARFDEPSALSLAGRSLLGVSIHGQKGPGDSACVGGGNASLRRAAAEALSKAGFPSEEPCGRLAGKSPSNIVNRPKNRGLQLELTAGLIRGLLKDPGRMRLFCGALRGALRPFLRP